MDGLKIEVEETKTYWQRMKLPFLFGFALLTGWVLFIFLQTKVWHDPRWIGVLFYLLILAIYTWGCDNTYAYYITTLDINDTHIHIIYKKRNKRFELNDSKEKFAFKKRIDRAGPYFSIIYNGNLIAKQYKKWEWKEIAFNQTINYLSAQKLVKINWF